MSVAQLVPPSKEWYWDERDSLVVKDIPIIIVDKISQPETQPEKPQPEKEKGMPLPEQKELGAWLLPGLILAAVVIAGVLILLLRRR